MCWVAALPIAAAAASELQQASGAQAQASTLTYNANIAETQGKQAIMQGATQAQMQQNKVNATIGTARADVGASGVTLDSGGSSGKIIAQDAQQGALDVANVNVNAQRTAWGYDTQATLDRAQASAAKTASNMAIDPLSTMLTGKTFLGLGRSS